MLSRRHSHNTEPSDGRPGTAFRGRELVLVLTPMGKDGMNACGVLSASGIQGEICSDLTKLCDRFDDNTAVLLIAEEALTQNLVPQLIEKLNKQPAWSDIPIVVLTSGGETSQASLRVIKLFEKSGNVTLLERPIRALTLVSSVQVALRARRRQWEIRDLIKQRETLVEESKAARIEAENANRMKDEFLATLSHELRTPLNAILGWTQLLQGSVENKEEEFSTDELRMAIETIDRNAHTQAQLIEDLLDVSRITSGKIRLDLQPIRLADMIQAAVSSMLPAADAKGVIVTCKADLDAVVLGDPARLQQIVWNLLSNAVKFTAKGHSVTVSAVEESDTMDGAKNDSEPSRPGVLITVADDGAGIDPAFLPYVFDRFRQADGSTTRRQGGLGLGLSIVKQLVGLHGGRVEVESEGLGHGSVFKVHLPKMVDAPKKSEADAATDAQTKAPDTLRQLAASANGEAGKRKNGKIATAESSQQRTTISSANPNSDLSGVQILVVDDERDARDVLERALNVYRADVRVAASVSEALNLIDFERPDLIVSDISMPERDGYELIHELRSNGHASKPIPVIALTAFARPDDKERVLNSGFQAHLPKPVNLDDLLVVVQTVLATASAARNASAGRS